MKRRWLLLAALSVLFAPWNQTAAARGVAAAPVNVVLVHGFLSRGGVFDPMVRELEKAGCHCFAPSLSPNNGSTGVRDLSTKLSAQIDAHFGPRARFFLVGFSMGGIVTRDYVENTPGRARVRGLFVIAAPNRGTLLASLAPGGHLRELAPGSAFLRALNADESAWKTVPVHGYWTPMDVMVLPSINAVWPYEEATCVACPGHGWMVRNRAVIADIILRVRTVVAARPSVASSTARARKRSPRPPVAFGGTVVREAMVR